MKKTLLAIMLVSLTWGCGSNRVKNTEGNDSTLVETPEGALAELTRRAQKGDAQAMFEVGESYFLGQNGVEITPAEAYKWYSQAADKGNVYAKLRLCICYAKGYGTTNDHAKADVLFKEAYNQLLPLAEKGDALAQTLVGYCYENALRDGSLAIIQSYDEAAKWYAKAAEQGNAEAMFKLGWFRFMALNGSPSSDEAAKWYKKATALGNADATDNLGYLYATGDGVSQSDAEAIKLYRKAAEQGHAIAQLHLAECYTEGRGVKKSDTEAAKWYLKAAERGEPTAQYKIGECYEQGIGVDKSKDEAIKWYNKAAEAGDEGAQERLNEIV